MDEEQVTWTTIYNHIMKKYNLTANEYMLIDIVARMSRKSGYCWGTRVWLAEQLNMTKQGLMLLVDRLLKRGLLHKNEKNKLFAIPEWLEQTDGIRRHPGKDTSKEGQQSFLEGQQSLPQGKESLPNIENKQLDKQKETPVTEVKKGDWEEVKQFYEGKMRLLMDEEPFFNWPHFTKVINPVFKEWGKDKTIKAMQGYFTDPWARSNGYPLSVFAMDPNRYLGISKYDPSAGLGVDEYLEKGAKLVAEAKSQTTSVGLPEGIDDEVSEVQQAVQNS